MRRAITWILVLFVSTGAAQDPAQSTPPATGPVSAFLAVHDRAVAANPLGVTFTLSVVGARRAVHQGEVVEIDVALAAAKDASVVFAGGQHYLGHRNAEMALVVDAPDDAPDPLAGYEDSWVFDPLDLPLSGPSSGPQASLRDRVVLNELVRFDRPGRYAFYAITRATKPKSSGGRVDERTPGLATASNVVELEVLPDDEQWSREELGRITDALDRSFRPGESPVAFEAYRRLGFLRGEDALQEAVRRLTGDGRAEAVELGLGLLARQDRAATLAVLEARLVAPDQPIGVAYLRTTVALAFLVRYTDLNEPLRRYDDSDAWRTRRAEALRALAALEREYRERLTSALTAKTGEARAVTAMTLALPGEGHGSDESTADADLTASFGDLPPDRQLGLLENAWDRLDHERVRPALRRIVETAPDGSPSRLDREPDVRSYALRRLAQIDPGEARPLLLAELARYPLRVDPVTLGMLPDETRPELDATLGAHLDLESEDFDLRLRAVERYASPALAARMMALYSSAKGWACAPQAIMLAYLLRAAPDEGVVLLRRALAFRKETGCYRSVLSDIARLRQPDALLFVARERLSDSDAEVRRDARRVLSNRVPMGCCL